MEPPHHLPTLHADGIKLLAQRAIKKRASAHPYRPGGPKEKK
jgi:hypothetical protein